MGVQSKGYGEFSFIVKNLEGFQRSGPAREDQGASRLKREKEEPASRKLPSKKSVEGGTESCGVDLDHVHAENLAKEPGHRLGYSYQFRSPAEHMGD